MLVPGRLPLTGAFEHMATCLAEIMACEAECAPFCCRPVTQHRLHYSALTWTKCDAQMLYSCQTGGVACLCGPQVEAP